MQIKMLWNTFTTRLETKFKILAISNIDKQWGNRYN